MSGDSKIGPQVGGVMRAVALRKIGAGQAAAARGAAPVPPAAELVPAARLIGLTQALADQAPPVDTARVASLRAAIADGSYSVDAGTTARAMIDHYRGRAEA